MDRRGVLKILGTGAVIVAAGAGGFATTRTPTKALAPWGQAGGADYSDPRVRALSYAILAPNPHNRQPWVVDLSVPNEATLFCDPDRLLKATDPYDRQIVIGLGCFLELLRIAAAEDGFRALMVPFPEGADDDALDGRPIARISFVEDPETERDLLFAQVLDRRSNKNPYDTSRAVPSDVLERIKRSGGVATRIGTTNDPLEVGRLRAISWDAFQTEMFTPAALQESIDLMRIGKVEINANPDGLSFGGPLYDTLDLFGLMSRDALADQTSPQFRQGLEAWDPVINTAMAHIWIVTRGNTRIQQLLSGQAWLRLNLAATREGVGLHPLSQALQEYPEMATLLARMREELGVTGEATVQMFGRLGFGPRAPRTPRWPVESRVTGAGV